MKKRYILIVLFIQIFSFLFAEQVNIVELTNKASDGDAGSQLSLGDYYQYALRKPDYAEAVRWYLKSAMSDNKVAQIRIGELYNVGTGLPKDPLLALTWLSLANTNAIDSEKIKQLIALVTQYSMYENKSTLAWMNNIGMIETRMVDGNSVKFTIVIGYEANNAESKLQLDNQYYEIKDFARTFFSKKSANTILPENESFLKTEIKILLNMEVLRKDIVKEILFMRLDILQ